MQDPFQLIGTSIEGRYRVDAVIGEGGFGVVYRGFHQRFEHPVAIKCLKIPQHFTNEAKEVFFQRFREEGKILLKLADAPGVPRVYDYGVISAQAGQVPYLVIDWLNGKTLEDMLGARRHAQMTGLGGTETLALLLPAVDALAIAHQNHIAHRDIKPANLFLTQTTRGPTLKVLDFGIAKAMQEGETVTQSKTQTSTSFRAFTPNYAAPEQFAPKRYGASGPWTDVHALGLLLVELLTDKPANRGEDFVECLESATSEQRPSPQGRGARVSDELEQVILKAVARSPEARFPDAGAFAAALRSTPEATQIASRMSNPGSMATEFGMPLTAQAFDTSARGHASGTQPFDPNAAPGTAAAVTGQPVATTHGGVAAKLVPPAPPVSKRKAASPVPIVIGGLAAVGLAVGVFYFATKKDKPGARGKDKTDEVEAAVSAEAKPETILAWSVMAGQDYYPLGALSEADVKGKAHYRVLKDGSKISRLERIDPSGLVQETHVITYPKEGGNKRVVTDGRATELETVVLTKDGHEKHLSRAGSPFIQGCAQLALTFDKNGDTVTRMCQDDHGHVIIDATGCQQVKYEYTTPHLFSGMRCLQEDGQPVLDSYGVHLRKFIYDARGSVTERSFHGIDGNSIADSAGCVRNRFEYDSAGNAAFEVCIGATGLPATFPGSNVAGYQRQYDDHGCVTKEMYIDVERRLAAIGKMSGSLFGRDKFCGELSRDVVDPAGVLVSLGTGPARWDSLLDGQGQVLEQRCFDTAKVPYNCNSDAASKQDGSVVKNAYDDKGRVTSTKAFDAKGTPTRQQSSYPHENTTKYDERGLPVEIRYFGVDGKPAAALNNVAKRVFQYDTLGAQTSFKNFGVDDAPVIDATGAHEVRRTYDDKHRLATIELRDQNGGFPVKSGIKFGDVTWPNNATKLVIVRDGANIKNRFLDKDDRELKLVDCTKSLAVACER
jgi:serine/threonine protein kinase